MDDVRKMSDKEIRREQEKNAERFNMTLDEYIEAYQTNQLGQFGQPKPFPISGIPPHERPGHITPQAQTKRADTAQHALMAVRNPPPEADV